ncbi:xanthine dehydrogenase family protein molybdopterin-binding subunit [Streptomyces collinus]|uniref:xanthine dehydrogenase family protein molybdopterin-binding subunit n=1 Tax=Streptomyces collinus TaxID=42684 RepID=UPI00369D3403
MNTGITTENVERYLTGKGTYLPDVTLPGLKHVAFARSPHPHARIGAVDSHRALGLPGVKSVLTGADLKGTIGTVQHRMPHPPFKPLNWPLLATDKARYIGDPVAVVVADNPYLAQDAVDLLDIRYEELAPVTDIHAAVQPGAPLLYEEWETNVFVHSTFHHGDLKQGFSSAAGILREHFDHHRVCGFPMEGHGVCAYREPSGRLIVHASTQFPHQLQATLADITGYPLAGIRVIAPDIGGGFGLKQHVLREELLVAALPLLLSCPVRWTQGITETVESGVHARQQQHNIEVGYRSDGRICALHLQILADVGNPLLYFTGAGPAFVTATSLPGAYSIPAYSYEIRGIATNTVPVGGYRGFGQPQALFTMERTLDLIARQLQLDPVAVRRVNLIPDLPRPLVNITGCTYDTGSVRAQFDRLLNDMVDRPTRVSPSPSRDLTGVGFACYVEPNAANLHSFAGRYGAYEIATLSMQPDGDVVACVGTKDIGQGCAASFARIIAEELTVAPTTVIVRDGDTDLLPLGLGTLASRALVMTGGALRDAARQLRSKLAAIAAHRLGVPALSVTFHEGQCSGGTQSIPLRELAAISYLRPFDLPPGTDPGLMAIGIYNARGAEATPAADGRMNAAVTYSSQVAGAKVYIDPTSGKVTVTDFTVVYDCGTVVNPTAVRGQIQGGFAQGLSSVLFEDMHYKNARPTRLAEYFVARITDVLEVRSIDMCTPSPAPGGSRGVGQATTILAPAAIANAVDDVLHRWGVTIRQSNLTPDAIRHLINRRSGTRLPAPPTSDP